MDIAVARYQPWLADTDILATKGGGQAQGTNGAEVFFSTANTPFLALDPSLTGSVGLANVSTPINNPFISGTGTSSNQLTGLISHSAQYNWTYTQGFTSGTSVTASWDNTRSSSSIAANLFNPSVQSTLTITFQQQLLNGFGFAQNRRNIIIAKNNRKLADYEFSQQAITTVTNAINAYWELVYARENVKVQQQAVTVSTKLYGDNKKQLEIGTMAPLEVTRAESELASDRQALIQAQTVQLTDEQTLKNAIVRDPLAPDGGQRRNRSARSSESAGSGGSGDVRRGGEGSVRQAAGLAGASDQRDQRRDRRQVEPTSVCARRQHSSRSTQAQAWPAIRPIITGAVTSAGSPIVGADGTPITVLDATGTPVQVFEPEQRRRHEWHKQAGVRHGAEPDLPQRLSRATSSAST